VYCCACERDYGKGFGVKKLVLTAGLALVLGGVIVWRVFFAVGAAAPPNMAAMGPMPVSVAAVVSRDVTEFREFSGRLHAVEQAVISPRVDGSIQAIHFTEGSAVKQGDLLFTIDPRPFEAALSRAEAALASAKAQVEFSKRDYQRIEALKRDDVVARRDVDTRRNADQVAAADYSAAEAALRTARLNLDYTQIRAPISGRVSRAEVTVGNVVQTAPSTTVLTSIVSADPIYADFDMDEPTYLTYVRSGLTQSDKAQTIAIEVTLSGDKNTIFKGQVKSFDNQLNAASGTIRVRGVLQNSDGLLIPGMYALVKIKVPSQGPATLIAERAINTDQNKKFVYVVDAENKASYRPIELGGEIAGGLRIVRSGLAAGEKIVVNGLQRAQPGAIVQPVDVAMDAPADAAINAARSP
jgi:membrane fusion protein, multidrug efflux system